MTDENTQPVAAADETAPPAANDAVAPVAPVATPQDAPPEPEVKHSPGVQKRIDELTRNWREAERRNDELIQYLQSTQKPAETPAEIVAPTLESVGYDEAKYQAELIKFARNEARAEARTLIEQERAQQAENARTMTFKQRESEFKATTPDYEARVFDPSLPISKTMAEVIAESELGPQVAYYLASNREVAARIAQLPERAAARELGRIEARLETPKPTPQPVVSKAPPPPPKIEGAEPEVDDDPDKLTDENWMKWREKQLRAAHARSFIRK